MEFQECGSEFSKKQLLQKFILYNDYEAEFWEFVSQQYPGMEFQKCGSEFRILKKNVRTEIYRMQCL